MIHHSGVKKNKKSHIYCEKSAGDRNCVTRVVIARTFIKWLI